MKILLAASNRDLLYGLERLLEIKQHTVTAAFDGIQASCYIADESFDLAIADENIPLRSAEKIIAELNGINTPVILLTGKPVNTRQLTRPALANSYLTYPFAPETLLERIADIRRKADSREVIEKDEFHISKSDFLLSGRIRLTNEEINFFEALFAGRKPEGARPDTLASAINQKFALLHRDMRIRYSSKNGYTLEMGHE